MVFLPFWVVMVVISRFWGVISRFWGYLRAMWPLFRAQREIFFELIFRNGAEQNGGLPPCAAASGRVYNYLITEPASGMVQLPVSH